MRLCALCCCSSVQPVHWCLQYWLQKIQHLLTLHVSKLFSVDHIWNRIAVVLLNVRKWYVCIITMWSWHQNACWWHRTKRVKPLSLEHVCLYHIILRQIILRATNSVKPPTLNLQLMINHNAKSKFLKDSIWYGGEREIKGRVLSAINSTLVVSLEAGTSFTH